MHNIADHKPHPKRVNERRPGFTEAHDVASGLVIELIGNAKRLRLNPALALEVESLQLLDCPIQLGSRSQ